MSEAVRIESIGAGGGGVARAKDGRVLFVQRTAPGEEVLVKIAPSRKRWANAQLVRVLEPSPARRPAPCPHYERCGGCTIEHLHYSAQLETKSLIVREALRRIGGLDVDTPEVVASPDEFRYRNRLSFTLRRLPERQVVAGFHELGRADRIVDITAACLLPEPALAEVWGQIRAAWGDYAARLPSGPELRLTLRTTSSGMATLLIEGGYSAGQPDVLLALVPSLRSIWHRARPGETPELAAGDDVVEETWGDETLQVRGSLFLQVNRGAAQLLDAHVLGLAAPRKGMRVVDAYSGVGLHARRFRAAGAEVTGIELDVHAAAEAERAGVRTLQMTVEQGLPQALPADLVVLNPPRGGVDPEVVRSLLGSPPERIIYVSCDPATLARDLSRLRDAYAVKSIRCFDLFPQTTHVETVVELTCSIM
ncbi:MAG TPA: 23S rRNA (uracil(1939)-C(5))-methyltransferase RlmD [Longimicrobiales bacterium]